MSDSEEEGFHQPPQTYFLKLIQFNQSRVSKIKNHNINLFKSPTSIFYQLPLFQYNREIDNFAISNLQDHQKNIQKVSFQNHEQEIQHILLLSQYFPIKYSCIYNRFNENLMIKRDTTIIIRNIERRIQNDQLSTFHQRTLPEKQNNSLIFSSDFEGGNLHSVFKSKENNFYYLLLQNDINTHGYNNWFHFNIRANIEGNYNFVIVNLSKKINFAEQLSLLVFSNQTNTYKRNLKFQCFQSRFKHLESQKIYWSIKFHYKFTQKQDVYFSLMPPYSYSKLCKFLKTISQPMYQYKMISVEAIYKTEIGNIVSAIKISNRQKSGKRAIVITARQHPCQTVGSFICEQLIKILISQQRIAKQLSQKFNFYIIPMVNPDGVIHGNSRTNILGYDINRSWNIKSNNKTAQSQNIWNYILSHIYNQTEISWFLDLHGHSKILGFCSYFSQKNEESLLMNYFLKNNSKYFDDKKSSFGLSKDKINSLRGQIYKQLYIKQSITIQTSLYGYRGQDNRLIQYQLIHFKQIAQSLLKSLLQTQKIKKKSLKKSSTLQQIRENQQKKLQQIRIKLLKEIQNKSNFQYGKQIDSDSNPQEDYLSKEQRDQQHLARQLSKGVNKNSLFCKTPYKARIKTSNSPNEKKELTKSNSHYNQPHNDKIYKNKFRETKSNLQSSNYFYRQKRSNINNYNRFNGGKYQYNSIRKSKNDHEIDQNRYHMNSQKKSNKYQDEQILESKSKQSKTTTLFLTSCNNKFEEKIKRIFNKSLREPGVKAILYPTSIANLGIELNKTNLFVKKDKIKQMRKQFLPYKIEKMLVENRIKRKIKMDNN